MGYFMIAGGLFTTVCAIADWEWFMNHYKARFMTSLLTREGARIFYVLLGIALIFFGVLDAVGYINMSS